MDPMPISMSLIQGIVALPFFGHLRSKVDLINPKSPQDEKSKKVNDFFQTLNFHVKRNLKKEQYMPIITKYKLNDIQRYEQLHQLNIRSENDALITFAKILEDQMPLIPQSGAEEIRAFLIANSEDVLKITNLDCNEFKMERLPREIGLFKSLQYFKADDNRLKILPSEFFDLSRLKDVSLVGNDFTEIDNRIFALPHLETLDFSDNKIEKLPDTPPSLSTSLKDFVVDMNNLTSVPEWISDLINLEELSLSGNEFTEVPKEIKKLKELTNLWLNENKIEVLPEWLGGLTTLELLVLSDNPISKLPDLSGLSNLEYLYLQKTLLKSVPKEYLPNSKDFELHMDEVMILEEGGDAKRVKVAEGAEGESGGGGSK